MSALTIVTIVVSSIVFLTGLASLVSVRSAYYEKYSGFSSDRPGFFEVAFAEHRPLILRGVVGIVAGLIGIVIFGLMSR